jgi:3-hydroxyacyl-CoA dehydrogenase
MSKGTRSTGNREETRRLLASRRIERVAVLGANGAMGYASGALFTSAVPRVTFLARTREKAELGLKAAIHAVRSSTLAKRVDTADYGSAFDEAISRADLIFEALAEDFAIKRAAFERIDKVRRRDSIVATVTSGLSIGALAQGRSESFRNHFLGLHFFNPPHVIVGTELVASTDTDPTVLDFVDAFARRVLGRVVVRTADTPGFAGNRIGFKVLNEAAQLAQEHGPLLVDRALGPYTGRALPPLATIDLVGWDIHRAIVDNIYEKAPDEAHATLALPEYMASLIAKGTLGNKSGRGFFKKEEEVRLVLDPKRGEYVPVHEVKLPKLEYIEAVTALHRDGRYREAMRALVEAPGPWATMARKVVAGYISYAFQRVGEVTESIHGIDDIMGYGFNWAPPSVLVDAIGLGPTVKMIEAAGLLVPKALGDAMPASSKPLHASLPLNAGRYFFAG